MVSPLPRARETHYYISAENIARLNLAAKYCTNTGQWTLSQPDFNTILNTLLSKGCISTGDSLSEDLRHGFKGAKRITAYFQPKILNEEQIMNEMRQHIILININFVSFISLNSFGVVFLLWHFVL